MNEINFKRSADKKKCESCDCIETLTISFNFPIVLKPNVIRPASVCQKHDIPISYIGLSSKSLISFMNEKECFDSNACDIISTLIVCDNFESDPTESSK